MTDDEKRRLGRVDYFTSVIRANDKPPKPMRERLEEMRAELEARKQGSAPATPVNTTKPRS